MTDFVCLWAPGGTITSAVGLHPHYVGGREESRIRLPESRARRAESSANRQAQAQVRMRMRVRVQQVQVVEWWVVLSQNTV